jgi:signal transduction histidine kinase
VRDLGRFGERVAVPTLLSAAVLFFSFLAPGRPIGLLDQPTLDERYGERLFVVAGVLALGCGVGAIVARRWRWPLYVFAVPAWLIFGSWAGLLTASYYAAVARRRATLVAFAAIVFTSYLVAALTVYPFRVEFAIWAALSAALVVGLPTAVGLWVRERRRVFAGLVERAKQAEREQLARGEQARVQERARIAREMHDVVAHRVSLMVLHAGALEVNAPDDATATAAALIRTTGRDALEELRAALGVLRSGDTGQAPLPTLADLDGLLEQSRAAGVTLSRSDEGAPRPFPASVERAAYRVVQEALTNVHKHAADAATSVVVRYLPGALEVAVRNDPGSSHSLPGSGTGLTGLRERVELLGGTFEAGRRLDGGFLVTARLPAGDPA